MYEMSGNQMQKRMGLDQNNGKKKNNKVPRMRRR
jgi:hypothetical protein